MSISRRGFLKLGAAALAAAAVATAQATERKPTVKVLKPTKYEQAISHCYHIHRRSLCDTSLCRFAGITCPKIS